MIMRTWTIAYDEDVTAFTLDHLPTRGEYVISAEGLTRDQAERARIALAFSGATDAHAAPDRDGGSWYVLASIDATPTRPGMAA